MNTEQVVSALKSLNPKYVVVEAHVDEDSPGDCIQAQVNGFNIYLDWYVDNSMPGGGELILNIYNEQSQVVAAYAGTLDKTMDVIRETVQMSNNLSNPRP